MNNQKMTKVYCPIRGREVEVVLGNCPWNEGKLGVLACLENFDDCPGVHYCRYRANSLFDPFEDHTEVSNLVRVK